MTTKSGLRTAGKNGFWERVKENKTIYFMLLPGIFFLVVFSLYPILWILKYMFYDYDSYGTVRFIGLDNFITLFQDKQFFNALGNTFLYAIGKILVTLPLSFLFAYLLNLKFRGRSFFRSMLFLPTIISISVMSMVFYLIFNAYNGALNTFLMDIHLIKAPVNWFDAAHSMITVLIIAVWGAIGNYMLYFLSGLQTILEDIYESADLDGATGWKKLWHITLPMMMPITQMVIMLAIIQAFKDYENIMVLTAGGPNGRTEVLYLYIYRLMFPMGGDAQASAVMQYGYGATVAFATAVLVGIVTVVYLRWSKMNAETF